MTIELSMLAFSIVLGLVQICLAASAATLSGGRLTQARVTRLSRR